MLHTISCACTNLYLLLASYLAWLFRQQCYSCEPECEPLFMSHLGGIAAASGCRPNGSPTACLQISCACRSGSCRCLFYLPQHTSTLISPFEQLTFPNKQVRGRAQCYMFMEKAPNVWHRRGTQKTGNTDKQPNRPDRHTSQTKNHSLSKGQPGKCITPINTAAMHASAQPQRYFLTLKDRCDCLGPMATARTCQHIL